MGTNKRWITWIRWIFNRFTQCTGSFGTTGSVFIDLDGVEDVFNIKVDGKEKIKVNTEGILQFASQSTTPTAVEGGMFYSSSNEYFLGFI